MKQLWDVSWKRTRGGEKLRFFLLDSLKVWIEKRICMLAFDPYPPPPQIYRSEVLKIILGELKCLFLLLIFGSHVYKNMVKSSWHCEIRSCPCWAHSRPWEPLRTELYSLPLIQKMTVLHQSERSHHSCLCNIFFLILNISTTIVYQAFKHKTLKLSLNEECYLLYLPSFSLWEWTMR